LRAVVCIKQVIDPLIPPASLQVVPEGPDLEVKEGSQPVPNGFDLQALEAALRIRDDRGDLEIIAVVSGADLHDDVLKRTVGPLVDDLVLVDDRETRPWDSRQIAMTLAAAIRHLGGADIVLCGRQSSDWNASMVPHVLAAELDLACLTLVRSLRIEDGRLHVECLADDGTRSLSADLPALVTVTSELGELRYPTGKERLAAARRRPRLLDRESLDIADGSAPLVTVTAIEIPVMTSNCEFIEAASGEEAGRELARVLMDRGMASVRKGGTQ
jgi:electron transfer flavoprotein beta subunit